MFKTVREVYQALLDGKKVRRDGWCPNAFLFFNDAGDICMRNGEAVWVSWLSIDHPEEWSIYEPPARTGTFQEAVEWVWENKGCASRRSEANEDIFLLLDAYGRLYTRANGLNTVRIIKHDVLATWTLREK